MLRVLSGGMHPYWSASAAGLLSPIPIDGLKLWLKSDAITGLLDGDPVSTWADSSATGNNATGSGSARPTYKTGIQNGLSVVRFDGSDDIMLTASNSFAASHAQHATIFVAYITRNAGATPGRRHLGIDANTNDYAKYVARGDYSSVDYPCAASTKAGVADNASVSASSIATNTPLLAVGVWNGTNVEYYQNGTLQNTTALDATIQGATANSKVWTIGAQRFNGTPDFHAQVDICEIIIYNTDLSDALREQIQTYLNAKWTIY